MSDNMKALFYIWRNQIINFYRLDSGKTKISDSFAFALSRNCFPFFHSDEEVDIFSEYFETKKERVEEIVHYIDEAWIDNKFYTYYELERHFEGIIRRPDLISVLRYCFLENRFFSDEFKKILLSSCPIEASSIAEPLREWEI